METTVNTKELISALKQCESVAGKRTTMPILAYTKLTLDEGAIRFDATDFETAISLTIPAEVAPDYRGKQFCVMPNLWRSLTGETTSIRLLDKGKVAFDSLEVTSESADEYPSTYTDRDWLKESTEIRFPNVISRINSVSYAASKDLTRYSLNSVCLEQKHGTQVAIGCDGRRLAYDETLPSEVQAEDYEYLIPLGTAKTLSKYSDIKDSFKVIKEYSRTIVRFSIPGGHIACNVVDGNYPDWRQVLPKEAYSVTFDAKALLDTLKPLAVIKPDKLNSKGKRSTYKDIALKVEHNCTETSFEAKNSERTLKVSCPSGNERAPKDPIGISLNYLKDALQGYKGKVSLGYSDSAALGPIGLSIESSNVRSVIMPIRFE